MHSTSFLALLALPMIALAQDQPRNPCYVLENGPYYCDEGLSTHWSAPDNIDAYYGAQCQRSLPISSAPYVDASGNFASYRACLGFCARRADCQVATYNRATQQCRFYNGSVTMSGPLYSGDYDVATRLPPGSCTQRSN